MQDSKPKALIVDDNPALTRVTQFALERAGMETATAADGYQALQMALATQFDVVITDQQMPRMTGIELCQALRDLPVYRDCPIVLLTAKGLELELPRLREELGIDGVFAKPFSPAAVVEAVGQLLQQRVHQAYCQ